VLPEREYEAKKVLIDLHLPEVLSRSESLQQNLPASIAAAPEIDLDRFQVGTTRQNASQGSIAAVPTIQREIKVQRAVFCVPTHQFTVQRRRGGLSCLPLSSDSLSSQEKCVL